MDLGSQEWMLLAINFFNIVGTLLEIGAHIAVIALAISYFKNRKK